MAKVETSVTELKINKLTKEQYDSIQEPSNTELYFVSDEPISYNDLVDTPDLKPVATSGDYNDLNNKPVFNGIELNNTNSVFYGVSTTAAATVQKEVSIPSITQLKEGQIIVVQPTVESTVANSTLKLNDFDAYPMWYNNAAITTSTDSVVWSNKYPSIWVFNGTYWVFLAHGVDSNTTYTMNYNCENGQYTAGTGSYAISRYSLVMQKEDLTWEKITATNTNYSTGTKAVNTSGFLINQIRYYYTTTNYASGAKIGSNYFYDKYSSIDARYSFNCGSTPNWGLGNYIYLVGTLHDDGLFYLDSTQWWTNTLPDTNDGKYYVRLGLALSATSYTISLFYNHPVFYHDGEKLCEYLPGADNKQDKLVSGTNIKTINNTSLLDSGDISTNDLLPDQTNNSGKFLTTDGTDISWASVDAFPSQSGNSGKFLMTDGSVVSWEQLAAVATSGSYTDLLNKPTIEDLTTTAQQNALNSGATSTLIGKISTNESAITTINGKIPSAASSSNQLADKDFVNSTVTTLLARYITSSASGDSFATNAALLAGPYYLDGTAVATSDLHNNDYAMVMEDETHDNKPARYIWSGSQWSFQYVLNNTTFTQAQVDAMNSTITQNLVNTYSTHVANNDIHVTTSDKNTWNAKQNAITGAATTITNDNLTSNRAIISNGSGKVAVSDTTSTELGYVHGVTSSIQTQLNSKAADSNTVHKTGNESIGGIKTFTEGTLLKYITVGDTTATGVEGGEIKFVGASGEANAGKAMFIDRYDGKLRLFGYNSNGDVHVQLQADAEHNTLSGVTPTEDTTSSTQIDTVGARNTKLQGYQPLLTAGTGIEIDNTNTVNIIQLDKTYTEIGPINQSSEGVYFGFSKTAYVRLALGFSDQFINGFGLFRAKTGSSVAGRQVVLCDTATTQKLIAVIDGVPSFYGIDNCLQLSNTPLSANTWYWFGIVAEPQNGDITYMALLDNDYTVEQIAYDLQVASQTGNPPQLPWVPYVFADHEDFLDALANTSLQVGKDFWGDYWTGEIDLKDSVAVVSGQFAWGYADLGVVPAKATIDKYGLVRPDDTTITINDGIISYKNTNGYITADDATNIINEQRTNCITKIPQDIKLELYTDGNYQKLKLKAGSKVYIPNGKSNNTNIYQEVDITSDVTQSSTAINKKCLFYYLNGLIYGKDIDLCVSGDTEPAVLVDGIWYDTANNRIKWGSQGIWNDGDRSLPICVAYTGDNGNIVSIEQIFNGFGYIGSKLYYLPGIEYLVPNGRNEDGTLKNRVATTNKVYTTDTYSSQLYFALAGTGDYAYRRNNYLVKTKAEMESINEDALYYVEDENLVYSWSGNSGIKYYGFCMLGKIEVSNGKVVGLNFKDSFNAVNYYDFYNLKNTVDYQKANISLDNLNSTGKNIANWSNNVSNCLTEIPQDINIVSNNDGSFTIKAGSKFCISTGTSTFNTVVLPNDVTINPVAFTDRYMYFMAPNGGISRSSVSYCFSGTTAPTGFAGTYALWYDTTNGVMKLTSDNGTTWTSGYSFPVAIVSSEANVGFTIERVFNGIGYIGNTIFALPGIKGLIPDGRNEDGTLKSIPFEITKPLNRTLAYPFIDAILILNENAINCGTPSECFYQEEEPENPYNKWTNWYNPKTNLLLASPQNTTDWSQSKFCYWFGYATKDITSFYDLTVDSAYQAPSRDDVEYMIEDASNSERTCCMIQADQNIKIVLDSSTHKLTLKAGSVIYKPAGMSGSSRLFARYVIPADVVMSSNYSNYASSTHRLFGLDGGNGFVNYGAAPNAEGNRFVYSGTTAPTEFYDDGAGHLGAWWYDTSTNYIKVTSDGGTTWTTGYSFPICSVTIVNGTGITELEHVFSNFGYMGSHVFSLPGVKGLEPYGRTEDGKLYNLVISSRCSIYQGFDVEFIINRLGDLNEVFNGTWIEQESLDGFPNYNGFWYNTRENRTYRVLNGVPTEVPCYKVFRGKDVIWKNGVGTINDIELYQPFREINQEWVQNYVKYDKTSNVVHKTGDETISGIKTFNSRVRVNNTSSTNEPHLTFINTNIVKGATSPASNRILSIDFAAGSATTGTNTELGYVRSWYNTANNVNYSQIDIIAIDPDPNHTGNDRKNASMYLYTNGTKQFAQLNFEPTDVVSSTSYSFIPTMGWVNDPARSLNVVHRSGNETISGVKEFTNIVNIKDITYDLFDSTASSRYLYFRDKSSHSTGWVETRINHDGVEGESRLRLFAQTYTDNTFTTTVSSTVDVVARPDGTKYATAPTPAANSNDTKIATTQWVRANINNSIDNTTISKNASDKLQAIGTVNKNTTSGSTNPIYDWVGTLAEYESQNVATAHPDWVCYITDDVEGGETVYTKTEQDVMLAEKADIDLGNSTRLTNCILDIPQDVKITLSADKKTAYVEAGSVMYYPDGFEQDGTTKKFTKIILNSRRAIGIDPITTGTAPGYFPIVFRYTQNSGNGIFWANVPFDYCVSGSTNPGNKYEWYDTTNNIEGYTLNGAISDRSTFPIGMLYRDEDNNLTIAQIYNGFGYIGSTVYAVPGIKYLMPDGLQTGGQLKTIENTTSVLSVVSSPDTVDATQVLFLDSSGIIQRANVWISSTTKPVFTENYSQFWFNPDTNLVYRYRDSSTQGYINACLVGRFTHNDSTKITDFSTRNAFIAADYNELDGFVEDKILECGYRPTLFAHEWDDKLRNDVQWLRGDTFSWQDGKVYKAAYKHLYDDFNNAGAWQHETIAGHTIGFKLAPDGHKITDATDASVSAVAAIYEDTGIAWYYIIDTTNQRFKLPRDNNAANRVLIKTLDLGAGWARIYSDGWVEQGQNNVSLDTNGQAFTMPIPMTNSTYNLQLTGVSGTSKTSTSVGVFVSSFTRSTTGFTLYSGDDTTFNACYFSWKVCGYGNTNYLKNISTQFDAEHKYLYFYVGKYTQSALLNTAGMKTETVNDKADRNLLNSVPTSQFAQLLLNAGIDTVVASQLPTEANGYKWYRKYASGWVEQGGCYDKGSATRDFTITIDLPITMLNNLYTATATCARNTGNATNRSGYTTIFTQSETQLGIGYYGVGTSDTMQYINWEVKGKAAN